MTTKEHWETIYQTKESNAVSWYRPHLEKSLVLIKACGDNSASVIDVGSGASTLADDLLAEGYKNLTILDISEKALETSKERLGQKASSIIWKKANIIDADLPENYYDIWHDRAAFHFLTTADERSAYIQKVLQAVKSGGSVIMATFGPEGPEKCSGLNVIRYDPERLQQEFKEKFQLLESCIELHKTPFNTTQQFLYCRYQIR